MIVTLVALKGNQPFVREAGALRGAATCAIPRYAAVRPEQGVIRDGLVLRTGRPLWRGHS